MTSTLTKSYCPDCDHKGVQFWPDVSITCGQSWEMTRTQSKLGGWLYSLFVCWLRPILHKLTKNFSWQIAFSALPNCPTLCHFISWLMISMSLSPLKCCFVSYNVPASELEHLGPPDAGEPKLEVNFWGACLAPGSKCPNLDIIKSFSVSEWNQRAVVN